MLRVAIAGTGNISESHERAWKKIEGAEIVAVFDWKKEQMEKYPYARPYTDYDEMLLNENLDIVDICLPVNVHTEFSLRAMERGIHVICEKPVSMKKEDIRLLYDTAEKNNVKFMVAQCVRFRSQYEMLKKINDTKKFGRVLSGEMHRVDPLPQSRWMLDPKLSGGVGVDLHLHDVDFLVHMFGKPDGMRSFHAQQPNQDYVHVIYDYNGFSISASAAWFDAPYDGRRSFTFQFERAVVEFMNGKFTVYTNETLSEDEFKIDGNNPYEAELRYFTECVRENMPCDRIKLEELEIALDLVKQI